MAKEYSLGGILFTVGLILAAIIAVFSYANTPTWAIITIALLGLIVGLLNVKDSEMQMFLIASITFLISFQALSNVFTTLALGWQAIASFFDLMSLFVAPAAAVVAVKSLFKLARD
ncbi:hypothetical protein J4405_02435 [Candidatus Woesearchaeota archaeon]|nr:hypothetical protein [Candidatus Woesearchaeota archaeon]